MNCYEKYYRRSYNALNKLIDVYKDGYVLENTNAFRRELNVEYTTNQKVLLEEQNNIIFTTLIALFGLNKESVEGTGKFENYAKNSHFANVRTQDLPQELKNKILMFDNQKVKSTDFDEWLSIIKEIPSDTKNTDHLKRIRNGLLHSNFYIDDEYPILNICHIKTKSYYEAEILGPEFNMFVLEYFSNIEALGLSEKMYLFDMMEKDIKSREELMIYLQFVFVREFIYNNIKNVSKDTPESIVKEMLNPNTGVVNTKKLYKKIKNSNNFENFKINKRPLTRDEKTHLFLYIEKNFGDKFYELDKYTQGGIISTHMQYILNPKREVSNWLLHFSYLFASMYNGTYNSEFFLGDDYANESCFASLLILKAYLIMYRLENNVFEKIDYSLLDINLKSKRIEFNSENINDINDKTDYFKESFIKEKNNNDLDSDLEVANKIVCDVLRNALAHGNVLPKMNIVTMKNDIEIVDLDKSHGTKRSITMPIEVFEKLLNSEAFEPKNCRLKVKDDVITLKRKKSE